MPATAQAEEYPSAPAEVPAPRCSFDVPIGNVASDAREQEQGPVRDALPKGIMALNVAWFCDLRWLVATLLGAFGIASLIPGAFDAFGLRPGAWWSIWSAAVLIIANVLFLTLHRRTQMAESPDGSRFNLWAQIVVDLAVLTVVVHFVGSQTSPVASAYLFHIVLACIFLSTVESLKVTVLACVLFSACVGAEASGLIARTSIYLMTDAAALPPMHSTRAAVENAAAMQMVWLIVWHLTSHLAALVRVRDAELVRTNRRLLAAQLERAQHMLVTTHELKAPFAAIDANTQILLQGYCGELPTDAVKVLNRMSARCRRLGLEIQDMLQLANLSSFAQGPTEAADLDLVELLKWCIEQTSARAEERRMKLTFRGPAEKIIVHGVDEHLKMLFSNLISNAVSYSQPGGRIMVRYWSVAGKGPRVWVRDWGIGIPQEKIQRVFEEYYRTDQAVRHCRESTGLGLAIVRRVAEMHNLRVRVTSRFGEGTGFRVIFQDVPANADP